MSFIVVSMNTLKPVDLGETSEGVPLITPKQVAGHHMMLVTCSTELHKCRSAPRKTSIDIAVDMEMTKIGGHTIVVYIQFHINTLERRPQSWVTDTRDVWDNVRPFMHKTLGSTSCKTAFRTSSFNASTLWENFGAFFNSTLDLQVVAQLVVFMACPLPRSRDEEVRSPGTTTTEECQRVHQVQHWEDVVLLENNDIVRYVVSNIVHLPYLRWMLVQEVTRKGTIAEAKRRSLYSSLVACVSTCWCMDTVHME